MAEGPEEENTQSASGTAEIKRYSNSFENLHLVWVDSHQALEFPPACLAEGTRLESPSALAGGQLLRGLSLLREETDSTD